MLKELEVKESKKDDRTQLMASNESGWAGLMDTFQASAKITENNCDISKDEKFGKREEGKDKEKKRRGGGV